MLVLSFDVKHIQEPERTIGASITPSLNLSDVRLPSFRLFDGLGLDGGEGLGRRDIFLASCEIHLFQRSSTL